MAEILLIDDMAGVRRSVISILTISGHRVTACENGAQGIDMLKERRFDLVITDMLMPGIDGGGVLSHVKAMPDRPRVIAISGGSNGISAEIALRAARAEADACLEKPFERADLVVAVHRVLRKVG
jgi:two-component system response regulator PfeR